MIGGHTNTTHDTPHTTHHTDTDTQPHTLSQNATTPYRLTAIQPHIHRNRDKDRDRDRDRERDGHVIEGVILFLIIVSFNIIYCSKF